MTVDLDAVRAMLDGVTPVIAYVPKWGDTSSVTPYFIGVSVVRSEDFAAARDIIPALAADLEAMLEALTDAEAMNASYQTQVEGLANDLARMRVENERLAAQLKMVLDRESATHFRHDALRDALFGDPPAGDFNGPHGKVKS